MTVANKPATDDQVRRAPRGVECRREVPDVELGASVWPSSGVPVRLHAPSNRPSLCGLDLVFAERVGGGRLPGGADLMGEPLRRPV